MLVLIPRLVLDEDEVSKIIHDAFDEGEADCNESEPDTEEHNESRRDGVLRRIDTKQQGSIIQKKYLSIFDSDEKKSVDKIRKIITRLRENVRAAPNGITHKVHGLPGLEDGFVTSTPFLLAELKSTIIVSALNGKKMIIAFVSKNVNMIKDLPHRATFQWRHLLGVLVVMILCPLLGEVVFFLPMNSVDKGPDENKVFIYGIMTLYQFFMQLPWVETCNFAMPQVDLPIRARLVALVVGLMIAKLIDLILTKGIFTYEPVFPIPFSILVTGALGTLPAVPILYCMTIRTKRKLGNFGLMFMLLVAYWIALLVVIGWAIGIQRLQGKSLQYLVLFSYALLRFICKVIICANVSTRLQPKRHIQLNLVVDILFTRVQVATWPFIDSPFTLMALFVSESSVILWRYYDGVDRIQLWWGAIVATASLDHNQDSISKRRRMKGITEACFTKSNQYIINMSLSQDKADVIRNLASCKTSPTLADSSYAASNSINNRNTNFRCNKGTLLEPVRNCTKGARDNIMVQFDDDQDCDSPSETIYPWIADYGGDGIYFPSLYDDDDEDEDDSSMESTEGRNGLPGILRRPVETVEKVKTDEFVDIELGDQSQPQSTQSSEETWEQRDLYHMVDSTGSLCVNIIVRINQQLVFIAVRNLPSSEHLNESFQISDERWREAQVYGSVYITLMFMLVIGINFTPVFFSKKQGLEGKKLSLGRVLSYLFKENFWYFFFWLISTGALVSSAMVNHFGADFSMKFKYLSCLDKIEWPGCPSEE